MQFIVSQVGSWPRSRDLLRALRDRRLGARTAAELDAIADGEVRRCVEAQLTAGVDVVVDGEQRRDNFYSFVTEKLAGTRLMSLAEMLELVEDKAGFEDMLETLDVPASAIRNPTCVGPLSRRLPLAADEVRFVQTLTDRPVKATLPGPYLLTRSMWVSQFTAAHYEDKLALGRDVVRVLREELAELTEIGCAFVQFDEPVLTEVVFSDPNDRRTFM